MKFLIDGREYDLERGVSKASLYTLFELKSKYGIGMKSMAATAKKMEKMADPLDLLEDEETLKAFMAVIWLARRQAGEKLTLEEANDIPIDGLEVIHEEGEEMPDPKDLTVSGPAAKRRRAPATLKT